MKDCKKGFYWVKRQGEDWSIAQVYDTGGNFYETGSDYGSVKEEFDEIIYIGTSPFAEEVSALEYYGKLEIITDPFLFLSNDHRTVPKTD